MVISKHSPPSAVSFSEEVSFFSSAAFMGISRGCLSVLIKPEFVDTETRGHAGAVVL